jgi:hypothetical protein
VNLLFIPTLLLTALFFIAALKACRLGKSRELGLVGLMAGIPAILFAAHYSKILGEAKWFYSFRSWPFTELSAAGVGLSFGWLEHQREQIPRLK